MYKLLIIDDEIRERNEIYDKMFSTCFDLTKISNEEDEIIDVMKNNIFDGIVLDSTLTSGMVATKVKECIADFSGPIILVSDKREFDDSDRREKQICDCISLCPLFNCMEAIEENQDDKQKAILDEIERGLIKDIQDRIRAVLSSSLGYYDKDKRNKLSICHIADLQFGDPSVNEFDLKLFFTRLTNYLKDREPKPDLIVIAGDIVYSGKKKEYVLAKSQIEPFLKVIYGEEYSNHVILVPGNHDYDYSTNLIDESSSVRTEESKNTQKEKLTPSDFEKFYAPDSASYYFSKFAFELTGNSDYWINPLKIESKQLMAYGYRVMGVSNAMQYQVTDKEGKKRYVLETDGLEIQKASRQKQPSSIIVGHISPKNLGYKDVCESTGNICNKYYDKQCQEESQCRKWVTSKLLLEAYNASIYLYGHQHYSACEISNDNKHLFIAAGTPSGIHSEMTFNIIEIENSNGTDELTLIVNKVGNDQIKLAKCDKYSYKRDTGIWEKV